MRKNLIGIFAIASIMIVSCGSPEVKETAEKEKNTEQTNVQSDTIKKEEPVEEKVEIVPATVKKVTLNYLETDVPNTLVLAKGQTTNFPCAIFEVKKLKIDGEGTNVTIHFLDSDGGVILEKVDVDLSQPLTLTSKEKSELGNWLVAGKLVILQEGKKIYQHSFFGMPCD